MNQSQVNPSKGKRTRINVKQSKFGCFTCKKRRVKCDESKPSCLRCLSYNLSCLGYPRGAPPGPWIDTSSSAVIRSENRFTHHPNHPWNRYSHLACTIFRQGPRRAKSELEAELWSRTIPQLIHSVPFVRAAAAAFGASYEQHTLRPSRSNLGLESVQLYCQALRLIQVEVSNLRYGFLPSTVACLLMAFTEALQQRSDKAYLHLRGAAALMVGQGNGSPAAVSQDEGISTLFEKLDLHTATYVLTRSPDLPSLYPAMPHSTIIAPDRALCRILHACYHFISAARQYKYTHSSLIPSHILIEQGRHLGNLQQWLSCDQLDPSRLATDPQNEQLIILRAQSLAGLIHCATVIQPYETCYDSYDREFKEIIKLAEALFDLRPEVMNSPGYSGGLPHFAPEMGIIQPLFLTALKYRHPSWRRKALELLQRSGREGPWCGAIEAAVLKVAIEAEEAIPYDLQGMNGPHQSVVHQPSSIPESQRVHLCWIVGYVACHQDNRTGMGVGPGTQAKFAKVQLCKCLNLDGILNDENRGPYPEFWQDQANWYTWLETVQLFE
ncbi:uncharacterized protein NECHADRAFT_44854 [Fusarium vanettenii 77-13-4]|uniref:Zn(2)-C6 fungal-type domain-containing protein n=1 Tax=Fusarium vanettenii (strain ATCC MYA-4622 / CBS 123669 / FGSC 9596 / NRRL 45880 / 77-13-4) TaxID=660122 RepID=C7ZLQ0_FUSV7|nr:uncharacterized protein NECHADRAFT_44854 [Fusarium vanettenii 77-13-4]EEU35068.1 hypothetical protein NECHADRAFT_44854 [Fusarium vanettenii 77-13-4]